MPQRVLATTVVGSYPQPDWLVDRGLLAKGVPRVRLQAMWRIPEPFLEQAQDDATLVAIRDMERAGIDIISDGEIRRESYSNRFATALSGVDAANPGVIKDRNGNETRVPRVVDRIRRTQPVELRDMQFLRKNTDRPAKITLPGPFTMAQQARNEFYKDVEEMAMDFAAAVNAEARDLEAAGADVIQLDEPWLRNDPEGAKRYAVPAINRALAGLAVPTALHLCFGYAAVVRHQKPAGYSFLPQLAETIAAQISIEAAQPRLDLGVLAELSGKSIILGVIDLGDPAVETTEQVAGRIRAGLTRVAPERLILAPDCGMKYLPRDTRLCEVAGAVRRRARRSLSPFPGGDDMSTSVLLTDEPLSGVRRLTLNRPEKRNALNNELRGAILAALRAADADPSVKVSIMRGAGPCFSSGYDLSADNSVDQPFYSPGGPGQWARHVVEGWFTIWDLAKPVIAQVHGYCLAGGSELAACCDLVYVAEDARIGYPPTRLMSPPDNQFHPWLMGMRTAMEMFLTGDAISGTEAAAKGFANRAVAAAELDKTVLAVAERIALVPTELAQINKRAVHRAMEIMGLRAAIRAGTELQALAFSTAASQAYRAQFKRDGTSVRDLLSQRDAAFGDYRERDKKEAGPAKPA